MMYLAEIAPVDGAVLPLAALKDHLRLPAGFADDGSLDTKLEASVRAALARVEAQTSKALFERRFEWRTKAWHWPDGHPLPLAPVTGLEALSLELRDGSETVLDVAEYDIVQDQHRPLLRRRSGRLPSLPIHAFVRGVLVAGYGTQWTDLPADLREAVLIMASGFYDGDERVAPNVELLVQRHRPLSLGGIGR